MAKFIRHTTAEIGGGWFATLELIEERPDGTVLANFALGPGKGPFFSFAPYKDGETLADLVVRAECVDNTLNLQTLELPWIKRDPTSAKEQAEQASSGDLEKKLSDMLHNALQPA